MLETINNQPRQQIPYKQKGKQWRRDNVQWADNMMHNDRNAIRLDYHEKVINYDLINGILHMEDVQALINPEQIKAKFIPTNIQHYPIINRKISLLVGEESKRLDQFSVKVTNPNSISEIEEAKKQAIFQSLQEEIQNDSQSEEEFNQKTEKLNQYYTYEYQDFREIRANCIINHYNREQSHNIIFNKGFKDACIVGEELYQIDIIGGEPVLEKLNPKYVKIYMSGYSPKVEDADMIIITEYKSPGQIYDEYGDVLTKKDQEYIENRQRSFATGNTDNMDNWDERKAYIPATVSRDIPEADDIFSTREDDSISTFAPFDQMGNIRVLKVYWKSRRKIQKIKFYDPETGEEDFTFMPEDYVPNESMGEESETMWVNEAWEGIKIGESVFVNIRPRPVQYNVLGNPGRCHFGIIGTIYNLNDEKPYSLVSMAKPFNYLYDIVHDRLNKMMARNWGKMTRLNLALKPADWDVDKWLYFAKTMGLYVEDGFNEGSIGAATGKLAGAMNMNSNGVIDADFGNNIQQYTNFLMYLEQEMSDTIGISKQREGQISNRETVGGVERATLQSSHITEQYYLIHDDTKKRVREAFIETFKVAYKGRNKKFQYILPDFSTTIVDIDGDEFAESDYGIVIDNSNGLQELQQKLETLAQAALQTQTLSFSTIMKLFMSCSLAEKQRFVEADERMIREQAQKQQEQQMQMQQQQQQAMLQQKQMEMQQQDTINQRDNETKIMVAEINSQAEMAILQLKNHMTEADYAKEDTALQINKDKLMQEMQVLDKKMQLERDKIEAQQKQFDANLKFQQDKARTDAELKRRQINKSTSKS